MPELPEVQTIVDDLRKKIQGEVIADFWSDWKQGIRMPFDAFVREIKWKKIIGIGRIGKNILLNLAGGKNVAIHLRMTGVLIAAKHATRDAKHTKHVHHIFFLRGGKTLEFSDIRKFGSLELVGAAGPGRLEKLGPDALGKKFAFQEFNRILDGRKTNIKQLLMDQSKIAGIGNIYASEILHHAGISPLRKTSSLSSQERLRLYKSIRKVLKLAIRMRGSSVSDYRDASGKKGGFQRILKVYKKAGKKCKVCGTIIKRITIGQRSTFFCPICQK